MAKFYIDLVAMSFSQIPEEFIIPTETQIVHAILENNSKVTVWRDSATMRFYAECENRPRDMPLYGIEWREEK